MDTIDKINQKLSEIGMSGAELTRAIGLKSTGVWSQWNKRITSPSRKNLLAIADVLHCSVTDLFPEKETPATDGDGLAKMIIDLPSEFQESLVRFVSLASSNPDKATRFLLFAAAELESDAQES